MKLDAQDQSSMLEVISDYFTLPTLDDELELGMLVIACYFSS